MVSLATARHLEVGVLGLGPHGPRFCPVTREYSRFPKGLDGVPLAAKFLTDPVQALCPFSEPFFLRDLELFNCFIMVLTFFVETGVLQHRQQKIRPRGRQCVHQGASVKHSFAGYHYFFISAGIMPCLISMSLVAMARATSTATMPTSQGVKSSVLGDYPLSPSYKAGCIPQGQRRRR